MLIKMSGESIRLIISLIILCGIHMYYSKYASFIKSSGGLGRVSASIVLVLTTNIIIVCGYIVFIFVINTLSTSGKAYGVFIGIPILIVICAIINMFTLFRCFIILTDIKKHTSTLLNCTIYRGHYFSNLVGVSKEGARNTFKLIGKDGDDVYRMIYNGMTNLEIIYHRRSKMIISIKPVINTPQQHINQSNIFNRQNIMR